jgi:uncharacterized protein YndB with AHSA1/START domain
LPKQTFDSTLIPDGDTTRLVTVVQYASADDLKRILEMGMQEGLTIFYEQLEALLGS